MSEENPPKLRLRPKLAGAPPANSPPAPVNPLPPPVLPDAEPGEESDSSSEPLAVWPEAKPAALRPKLSVKPDAAAPADGIAGFPKIAPQNESASAAVPVPLPPVKPVLTPRVKPTLIPPPEEGKTPDDSGATPPFAVPPAGDKKLPSVLNAPPPPKIKVAIPTTETWPAVLDAPPPSGLSPIPLLPKGASAEAEPAEIAAIRKASTFPFPSPTAKFPPLPGLGAGGTEPAELPTQESIVKKLLVIGGAVLLLLGGGAAFAYFKFFAKPAAKPATPVAPAVAKTQPTPLPQPVSKAKQMIDKVQQEQLAPLNEVVAAEPSPAKPARATVASELAPGPTTEPAVASPTAAEPVVAPPPAPVKPPPPPPPSLAFKAWVVNLKIRGVRGGEAQRVFIGKISYVPGDVVNQQLGIIFVGYEESTRMLKFQDKTGATFERRD